jgi:tripartite-type tricarboxylate transporter receptor subunit TctC
MLGAVLELVLPVSAAAQSYPARSIRYIVPFPPGGITDLMARNVAQNASVSFNQPVVVDNRAGGNAMIGADLAAKSPADGYTWLGMTITHTINATLFPQAPYNLLRDLTAVSVLASLPLVVVVNPTVPAKSLAQLTALGRARPLNAGSSGNGTPEHLALELYRQLTGVKATHVPYKGAAPATISLIGGELDLIIAALPNCTPHLKSGKLRALAITSNTRHPLVPEIPTTIEAGLSGLTITSWTGLMVPAATPADIVKRIHAEVAGKLKQTEMFQKLHEQGFEVVANSPEEAQSFMAAEVARWGKVVREANIKVD